MLQIKRIIICAVLAACCIVSQTGCAGKEPVEGSDFLLNTACSIRIFRGEGNQAQQAELIKETFEMCRSYENLFSRTIDTSDIGRINAAEGQMESVDPATAEVIKAGLHYAQVSDGLFDITVGELSDLWNFTGDDPHVPDASAIAEAVRHVGYDKVELQQSAEGESMVHLTDPETNLDLGGIAKGYIADKAAAYLSENGVESAIVDFGGNILCIGEKEKGTPFVIGVERPFAAEEGSEKQILGKLEIADKAIVTSGTYERKFYENGKLYFHILDPQTGYPRETDLDGVSIVGPNSTDCDGLSTTCLMLGLEKGKALIDSLPEYEAVFVGNDGSVVATDGLDLQLVD